MGKTYQKSNRYLAGALAACMLALCFALHGCGGLSLVPQPYGETGRSVPVVASVDGAQAINQALKTWFAPAAEALARLEESGGPAYQLSYELKKSANEGAALQSSLTLDGQHVLPLPDITIDAGGELGLPEPAAGKALGDEAFLYSAATLRQKGIETDFAQYDQNATNEALLSLFNAVYEHITEKKIDPDGVDEKIESQTLRKAVALGVQDYYGPDAALTVHEVNGELALDLLVNWVRETNQHVYGVCSQQATTGDVLTMLDWMGRAYQIGRGTQEDADAWGVDADQPSAVAALREQAPPTNFTERAVQASFDVKKTLSRKELAKLLVALYESANGPIAVSDAAAAFYDTSETDCKKAATVGFMVGYPSPATFSPDLAVRMEEVPSLIHAFLSEYMAGWYAADETETAALYLPLTYGQAVQMAATLSRAYENRPATALETQQRINDRPYDWYYSQNDTGPYSDINCMPTALAMVLKWKDKAFDGTAEQLRNAFPQLTGGWTMLPVEKTLQRYGVAVEQRQATLKNMLADLDQGKVLFCQCNDYDVRESGHCFVVYGYKKAGGSTWLLLHDPAQMGVDAYGQEKNKAKWMEAGYCTWIVERFSLYYLAVAP